jgi:mannose-1-phosphate guanylyltransferase
MSMTTYAVIMAGGHGERLWPLSTPERPKQFLRLFGDRTMLQHTAARVLPLTAKDRILVVAGAEHAGLVQEQLPWLLPENLVSEPMARNTAPCVALAAAILRERDPEAMMIVLPADHLVHDEERYRQVLRVAVAEAKKGSHLVTLGITPTSPATGYGYIRANRAWSERAEGDVLLVDRFVEKPDLPTAKRYLASGEYYWNSGMFIWHVRTILEELERYMPSLVAAVTRLIPHFGSDRFAAELEKTYQLLEKQSIDRGVMEQSDRILLVPASDIGWNDVGTWDSLRSELVHVEKPWGHEHIWAMNQNYVGKFLHIRAGESLSLQYHETKDETICVIEGKMRLRIGPSEEEIEEHILVAGDAMAIPPRTVHQMEAVEDTRIVEVSTPHLADVVRLRDRYGRTGSGTESGGRTSEPRNPDSPHTEEP